MNLRKTLLAAGLGTAMSRAANDCVIRHGEFATKYHYRFCPHCGVEIKMFGECKDCDRKFWTKESWDAHTRLGCKSALVVAMKYGCPKCQHINSSSLSVGYRECKHCGHIFAVREKGFSWKKPGPEKGSKHSPETKARISKAHKERRKNAE